MEKTIKIEHDKRKRKNFVEEVLPFLSFWWEPQEGKCALFLHKNRFTRSVHIILGDDELFDVLH